jgi:hypothetical protein
VGLLVCTCMCDESDGPYARICTEQVPAVTRARSGSDLIADVKNRLFSGFGSPPRWAAQAQSHDASMSGWGDGDDAAASWAIMSAPEQIVCVSGHPVPLVNGLYSQRGTAEVVLTQLGRPRHLSNRDPWRPVQAVPTFKNNHGVRLQALAQSVRGSRAHTDQIVW